MSVSAARSRVSSAKSLIESNRLGEAEAAVEAGEKFLEGLSDAEAAPLRAEFAALRATIAALPNEEDTRNLAAAKNSIRAVRSKLADKNLYGLDDQLKKIDGYMAKVREPHREPVASDLMKLRGEIEAAQAAERGTAPPPPQPRVDDRVSGAAPTPSAPAMVTTTVATPAPASTPMPTPVAAAPATATLSDDDHANLSRARGKIGSARSAAESRRTENVASYLQEATELLDKVPAGAAQAQTMRAQIDEIRALAAKADREEAERKARDELERHLHLAKADTETLRFHTAADALNRVENRLGEADIIAGLTPEMRAEMQKRVGEGRAKLGAAVKADALDRAHPLLIELEQLVENDPFAGRDNWGVNSKMSELTRLRSRIMSAVRYADERDPDIASVVQRVVAVDQKIEKLVAAWGKALLDASVANDWSSVERDIAGWEQEVPDREVNDSLHEPSLPLTSKAVQRTRWLLADERVKTLRAEHPNDPAIQGPYQLAERVFAQAADKLAASFEQVLDFAEKLETPMNQFVQARPPLLAYNAESVLEGTPHGPRIAARARALDSRWKAEVAAIYKARQDLYDKLAAEAETTWPRMRDAAGAVPFDPATARVGMKVRLDGYYNRCGWDWGNRNYDFATKSQGVVLGGVFAPEVLKALKHAWYELKLDVNDRIPWDLIAVIDGPGKIGQRTKVILRDKSSGLQIGEIEEWPPIDCWQITIVGLHAGPVAVVEG